MKYQYGKSFGEIGSIWVNNPFLGIILGTRKHPIFRVADTSLPQTTLYIGT